MSQTALQTYELIAGEVRLVSVSFAGLLDSSELLTGTPTVTEITSSDLTFSNEGRNATALTINGKNVPIAEAVQFKVIGQLASQSYKCEVSCGTDSNPAQTLKIRIRFTVAAAT